MFCVFKVIVMCWHHTFSVVLLYWQQYFLVTRDEPDVVCCMTEHTQIIGFSNNFSISFEPHRITEYPELEGTCQECRVWLLALNRTRVIAPARECCPKAS